MCDFEKFVSKKYSCVILKNSFQSILFKYQLIRIFEKSQLKLFELEKMKIVTKESPMQIG